MAKPDFYATKGDIPTSPLKATLKDANGDIVDLTNATSILFIMRAFHASTPKISAPASKVNPPGTDGQVQYTWAAGDLDTEGDYEGEFQVTFTGGKIVSFPTYPKLFIRVVKQVG